MEARKESTDLRQELAASRSDVTALRRQVSHLEELLEDAKSKVDTSAEALRMELRSVYTMCIYFEIAIYDVYFFIRVLNEKTRERVEMERGGEVTRKIVASVSLCMKCRPLGTTYAYFLSLFFFLVDSRYTRFSLLPPPLISY